VIVTQGASILVQRNAQLNVLLGDRVCGLGGHVLRGAVGTHVAMDQVKVKTLNTPSVNANVKPDRRLCGAATACRAVAVAHRGQCSVWALGADK
jgi:hypothetical protein